MTQSVRPFCCCVGCLDQVRTAKHTDRACGGSCRGLEGERVVGSAGLSGTSFSFYGVFEAKTLTVIRTEIYTYLYIQSVGGCFVVPRRYLGETFSNVPQSCR